jgi:hypothetical protein
MSEDERLARLGVTGSTQEPGTVSLPERLLWFVVLTTALVGGYLYLNANPLFTPTLLPMTVVDEATPFWPWTVWPYVFLLLCNLALQFSVRRRDNYFEMCVSFGWLILFMVACWTFWPTTYVRPPAPIAQGLTAELYLGLIRVDTPLNCFPSAHVASPFTMLYFLCRERPRLAPYLWGAFAVLSTSILTTKQHYLWDLIGALIFAGIALALGRRWAANRAANQASNRASNQASGATIRP